jgi:glutamyl-tRNA synthetase
LGNARTFLINYLLARQNGWRVLMRVEDLDGPRVKPEATGQLLDDLAWLGFEWEGEVVYQSHRAEVYHEALRTLIDLGVAYPCICSRKDIELAASAPHAEDAAGAYPGICRDRFESAEHVAARTDRPVAWRLRVADEEIVIHDRFRGEASFNLTQEGGDFVVFKNDGLAAYQLAVVVDDAAAGVDAVVRGHDLLDSAARQIHIRRLLGIGPEPHYWHLPLVIGPDGRRLAKRHGDTRLAMYRARGVRPQRVLGLLGAMSGAIEGALREASMEELQACFDLARLPTDETVLTSDLEAFLHAH